MASSSRPFTLGGPVYFQQVILDLNFDLRDSQQIKASFDYQDQLALAQKMALIDGGGLDDARRFSFDSEYNSRSYPDSAFSLTPQAYHLYMCLLPDSETANEVRSIRPT